MDNKVDIVRQNLILLIEEWMKQLDNKEDENEGMESKKDVEQEIKNGQTADAVFSVRELALFLGVSTDSVYTMVREQQIPYFRVRRRILFYRNAIEKWVERNEQ
jgi:excisionase family DNA binding protein